MLQRSLLNSSVAHHDTQLVKKTVGATWCAEVQCANAVRRTLDDGMWSLERFIEGRGLDPIGRVSVGHMQGGVNCNRIETSGCAGDICT